MVRFLVSACVHMKLVVVAGHGQHRLGGLGSATAAEVPAQRSSSTLATDGKAWMRGLKPTGRRRTCQPTIWTMRGTVFLSNPSSSATVR